MTDNQTQKSKGVNRRSFLKAAAVAGAPLILPSRLFAADAPSKRATIGLIGMGRQMVNTNLPAFLALDNCQVVAVCDVDAWRMNLARDKVESHYAKEKASGAFKGCAAYRDFRELLARPDLDAVMIATPDHWHVPMSIAAMKAGKDVSCEKPLSISLHEGRVLADTARKLKRVTRTDSEFRSLKLFSQAVECVHNGRIGTLRRITTCISATDTALPMPPDEPVPADLDYELWLGPAPKKPYTEQRVHPHHNIMGRPGWMRCLDYTEGLITNWGAHLNDMAQWANRTDLTGPVEVEATGLYPPRDGLWNVLLKLEANYRYANGVELRYIMEKRPYIRLEGDEGWIEVEYGKAKILASDPKIIAPPSGADWKKQVRKQDKEDFVDAVLSRGDTMENFEVGHRTNSVCQIAHIAIQTGRKLKWDPVAEKFDDAEANKLLHRPSWRAPWKLDET